MIIPYLPKAWLLTGLHLHPDSCVLQLETYKWNLANDPSEATGNKDPIFYCNSDTK